MKLKTYLTLLILSFFSSCSNDNLGIEVEAITLNYTSVELRRGDALRLIATLNPSNATTKEIMWKSSDTTIVTVDNIGNIEPINLGSAEIIATSQNNISVKCRVTIITAWNLKADFGSERGRYGAVSFSIGDKAYVGLGRDESYSYDIFGDEYISNAGSFKNDFWEYNPETDTWRKLNNFPGEGRTGAVGFSIDGKGYVGLGFYSDGTRNDVGYTSTFEFKQDFWEYNPYDDSWTQLEDFPGEARTKSASFVIDNKGYVACGRGKFDSKRDFWEFSPSDQSWKQLVDYPVEGRTPVGFSINNKGYVWSSNGFWEYSLNTGSWDEKQNAEIQDTFYYDVKGFSINGDAYICLDTNSFFKYNPTNNEWTNLPDRFPDSKGREAKTSFVVNEKAFLGLGFYRYSCGSHCSSFSPTSSIYQFIP
ncbi:Ig-like domain (group 2) [Maribacter sedimenticola]|uniref:Ig-like domain (Group 2) n=1 Tax=Maribacter sedimenticola TaxID=228956 RepID=A0ABY1SI61_9FLAO|nr:Ig-like domain-containing protein [Maribacter sedimenticola]SNR54328.1 Ig-like domain (group 2) [Maribacter sedimenticola]